MLSIFFFLLNQLHDCLKYFKFIIEPGCVISIAYLVIYLIMILFFSSRRLHSRNNFNNTSLSFLQSVFQKKKKSYIKCNLHIL